MQNSLRAPDHNIRRHILDFLERTRVLTLATCVNGRPWSTTLAFAYEPNFNLYCITNSQTEHVQQIQENPNVAIAMFEHQTPTYNPQTVKGLQLEGHAKILSGGDILHGLKVFVGRFPKAEPMSMERLFQLKTARIVRIRPSKLYYLDRENLGERVELELD